MWPAGCPRGACCPVGRAVCSLREDTAVPALLLLDCVAVDASGPAPSLCFSSQGLAGEDRPLPRAVCTASGLSTILFS